MPSIANLPNELVALVLEGLKSQRDIASLGRTNRKLYEAVTPVLYRNAVDRRDMWPLAFAAFSGQASTMEKILAAGADPDFLFGNTNLPREAWILISSDPARVPQPRNAPFGRSPTSYHGQYEAGRLWSPSSSDVYDAFYDEEPEEDEHLTDGDLDVWGTWTGMPLGHDDESLNPSELNDLDGDLSQHSPVLNDSDADSSTLGYSDRQRDGPLRGNDCPTPLRFSPLHIAAGKGNDEVVEVLLDHGATINSASRLLCGCKPAAGMLNAVESPESGTEVPLWTPLHAAICHSHPGTAMLLLSRGADCIMETAGHDGSTALHHAAALGQVDLVKYLSENGHQTDIDVEDPRTLTPFYYAYANGRWHSTIPLLLHMGANINVEIKFYQPYCTITPLGEAVRLGNFDDAQKLIDLGADPSHGFVSAGSGHRKGLSPLHLGCMPSARRTGSPSFLEEAEKALERRKIMETFISKGSDIHSKDCYGDTPLITAAQNGVLPSLRALIAAGADVNAKNALGRTVVMQAVLGTPNPLPGSMDARCNRFSDALRVLSGILGELLRVGARIGDVDPDGNNILHLLFEGTSLNHSLTMGMTKLLLSYPGADTLLTSKNKDGQLAFEAAFNAGATESCEIILRRGSVQRILTGDDLHRMFKFVLYKTDLPTHHVDLLLDLDFDRVLLSNTVLFTEAVNDCVWRAASAIARRGLPPLDRATCTQLLRPALDAAKWDLAYQLIEQGADVNAVDEDGPNTPLVTIIEEVHRWDSHQVERLVQILLERGANIHYSPCSAPHSRPLTLAIGLFATSLVRAMLRDQPLHNDPRAVGGYYLHLALRLVPCPSVIKHSLQPKIVYALIHSGADLAEVDENGDYPLAVLLRRLCVLAAEVPPHDFQFVQYSNMLRDLFAPGVRITKANNQGRSIVDYLEELLKTKAGQLNVAPKLELVEGASGAKVLRFLPDLKLRKMPEDHPETTIWDTRLDGATGEHIRGPEVFF